MNSERTRSFYALLLREWILMRTWVFSLALVVLAGPVINLLNMIGAPRTVRLTSIFESIYTTGGHMGTMDILNHHITAINYGPQAAIFIQGAPPASLWVIAVATALGAMLATIDRQTSAITDTLNAPVRKTDWIQAKFFFGTSALVIMVLLRTIILSLSNAVSPWHFTASTLVSSGVINLFIALAAFAVVFFMGMLVGNVLLAWCLGFLALAFPLALGALVRFLGLWRGLDVAYAIEHGVVLKFSPFWYTDYNTNVVQHFSSSVQSSVTFGSMTDMTMYTAINHLWVLTIGSIIVCVISNLCSVRVFARTPAENFANLFVSPGALHPCLTFASVIFGSIAAQIFGHANLPVFLIMALPCYLVLWLMYRQVAAISTSRVKRRHTRVV